ncbi:Polysaccharide deacetylase [Streptococcus sp. DD13]|nr:Polysaccharide deacetylase [Streptococcus sp. DD13]
MHIPSEGEDVAADQVVTPTAFEEQLQSLQKEGYYTLTPEEAYKALSENSLPKDQKVVWLTFDGGLSDIQQTVYPLLQKYQMVATSMLPTYYIENQQAGYLNAKDLTNMQSIISFQSQTVYYSNLAQVDEATQQQELKDSSTYISSLFGKAPTVIAYPLGGYTDTTKELASQAGYKLGLTTEEGMARPEDGLLSLKRITVSSSDTGSSLLAKLQAK